MDLYDPYISEYHFKGQAFTGLNNISAELLKSYDLIVITTAHTNIDYAFVAANSRWVFDTKNAAKDVKNRGNIELL